MNEFAKRVVSGLVGAAVVISLMLWSPYTFLLILLVAVWGGIGEYYTIAATQIGEDAAKDKKSVMRWGIFLTILSFFLWGGFGGLITDSSTILKAVLGQLLDRKYPNVAITVFFPAVVFLFFIKELYKNRALPFQRIGWNVTAFVYIILPILLLSKLYFEKGKLFVFLLIFMIWAFDSFCYITGRLFGKRKLFERISPKKTIGGFIGGLLLTSVLVFFYKDIANLFINSDADWRAYVPDLDRWQWLFIGIVTMVFAMWGDLVESMLKRSLNIKDSGNIMPGHGGFLDRLDAILVAIPFSVLAVWIADEIKKLELIVQFINS